MQRIDAYLQHSGVQPVLNVQSASRDAPVSLVVDQCLEDFPAQPPSSNAGVFGITWSPPMPNWNAWTASTIDEAPLSMVMPSVKPHYSNVTALLR